MTVESEYTAPAVLERLPPSTSVAGLLQAWLAHVQLPPTTPLARFRLIHKHRRLAGQCIVCVCVCVCGVCAVWHAGVSSLEVLDGAVMYKSTHT